MAQIASQYIWLPPDKNGEFDVEIGAKVIDAQQTQLKVIDDNGKERIIKNVPGAYKNMHKTSFQDIPDMIHLGDLTEGAICRNLLLRYYKDNIYTYIGSILIAVNPYQVLNVYNADYLRAYRNKKFGELEPHTFATGDNAYQNMLRDNTDPNARHNQCVIISGESGAGKTESTKHILQCLAAISGTKKNSSIEQQILEANPIMEAFGNAKTIRNDNSSRFGKYITIFFDEHGSIGRAKIDQYLLEKSRIVSQAKDERNYHIFYCLLAGIGNDERAKLSLTKPQDYAYLNKSSIKVDTRNDADEWKAIRNACKVLMFSDDELSEIFRILAVVLHLGNLQYNVQTKSNMDSVTIKDIKLLQVIASLLKVDAEQLNKALTTRTLVVQGQGKVVRALTTASAIDVRDAFVKGIYGQLFEWLIDRINMAMNSDNSDIKPDDTLRSIGVLDIFGFENFDKNSFEQLCINYTNEELQQFFVHHVFKLEQIEYEKEGVNWAKIAFKDNEDILNLLARGKLSIISLIDEETIYPQGTDETLCNKLTQHHGKNAHYISSTRQGGKQLIYYIEHRSSILNFLIKHFAGPVPYDCTNFLEKNRDTFSNDLKAVLSKSENRLIKTIFPIELLNLDDQKRKPSLANQFRKSLETLLAALRKCEPFFIRCIKPNEFKAVHNFDRERVVQQLRYSGMMETINIRKLGYPIRHNFNEFVHRYAAIAPAIEKLHKISEERGDRGNQRALAAKICEIALAGQDYQIGKTKVFLKDEHDMMLEQVRQKLIADRILALQKAVRRYYAERQFERAKKLARWLQQTWTCYAERKAYCEMRHGFRRLQAVYDMQHIDVKKQFYVETLPKLQLLCKGALARRHAKFRPQAIKILQEKGLQYLAWRDVRRHQIRAMKMEELENFRYEEEQRLTPELGPEKAREAAEAAYQERLANLEEEIHEQERQDIANAREKRAGRSGKDYDENGDLEGSTKKERLKRELDPFKSDVQRHNFEKFAAKYFQHGNDASFSDKEIAKSLLNLKSPVDQQAAEALFEIIMRFMGDKDDVETPRSTEKKDDKELKRLDSQYEIMIPVLYPLIAHQLEIKLEEQDDPHERKKKRSIRAKALDRIRAMRKKSVYFEERLKRDNPFREDRALTSLEKVQMISMLGIIRPRLRDEIFCQLCKQLTDHPAKRDKKSKNSEKMEQRQRSYIRGWFLLSLCLCTFPPSSNLVRFLRNFIQKAPDQLAEFCEFALKRTYKNGSRNEPLSMEEIEGLQKAQPMEIKANIIHGDIVKNVCSDPATTAEEACAELARQLEIKATFGWSLYAQYKTEGYSIGFNNDHVFDILSRIEMGQIELKGEVERPVEIQYVFCKQIFAPWENLDDDPIAIDYIYDQIINGIRANIYTYEPVADETEFVLLIVQHYYIVHGKDIEPDKMKQIVQELTPSPPGLPDNNQKIKPVLTEKQIDAIVQKAIQKDGEFKRVIKRLKQKFKSREQIRREIKKDVIMYAQQKWPMIFSRVFEISTLSGPLIDEVPAAGLSIGKDMIHFFSKETQISLGEIRYPEITSIRKDHDHVLNYYHYTLETVYGDYTFTLAMGADLETLLKSIHSNLKDRSRMGIAQKDYKPAKRGAGKLELLRGDIVILDDESKKNLESGFLTGINDRTNREGEFPVDIIYIIPCTDKPESKVLRGLVLHIMKRAHNISTEIEQQPHYNIHTLKGYAEKFFKSTKITAWQYEKDDIKAGLLRKLDQKPELQAKAVQMFHSIQQYAKMSPQDRKKIQQIDIDSIFDAAFEKAKALKEELYCQLIKQLTYCPDIKIETRMWELLWLLTGCLVPGKALLQHVQLFLRSSSNPAALECYNRIQKILKQGERVRPPHVIECNARINRVKIRQYVHFPNGREHDFVVESTTKAIELVANICKELKISSSDGLSVFLETGKKMVSIPNDSYFFDFLTQLRGHDKKKLDYKIHFKRKLWIDIVPGEDRQADAIVHFYQEKDKYLLGLHKCSMDDAVNLAALLAKADRGKGAPESNLANFVPEFLIKSAPQSEWAKKIYNVSNQIRDITDDDAKEKFLKYVSAWPTYGTSFYQIKNETENDFPEDMFICINQNGINIMNAITKEYAAKYAYFNINHSSNAISFLLEVHLGRQTKKYVFDTEMGDIIEDLIDEYLSVTAQDEQPDY